MTEIEYAVKLNDAETLWLMAKMASPIIGLAEGWVHPYDVDAPGVEMEILKMMGSPVLKEEQIWCTVKIVIEKMEAASWERWKASRRAEG